MTLRPPPCCCRTLKNCDWGHMKEYTPKASYRLVSSWFASTKRSQASGSRPAAIPEPGREIPRGCVANWEQRSKQKPCTLLKVTSPYAVLLLKHYAAGCRFGNTFHKALWKQRHHQVACTPFHKPVWISNHKWAINYCWVSQNAGYRLYHRGEDAIREDYSLDDASIIIMNSKLSRTFYDENLSLRCSRLLWTAGIYIC